MLDLKLAKPALLALLQAVPPLKVVLFLEVGLDRLDVGLDLQQLKTS
tara:strand:- start:338 stop:478 length:141 start_codon:yes stop_codon:yes gene_type:complete